MRAMAIKGRRQATGEDAVSPCNVLRRLLLKERSGTCGLCEKGGCLLGACRLVVGACKEMWRRAQRRSRETRATTWHSR